MTTSLLSFYNHNQKKIYITYANHFNSLKINKLQLSLQNNKLYILGLQSYTNSFKCNYKLLKKYTFTNYRILVKLNGLNFKFNILENYLQCILGYSHVIYILLPKGVQLSLIDDKKNLLLVESFNYLLVMAVIFTLKKIRPINPYNLTGICLNSQNLNKKIGKKK